jgi:mannose-6-phosphate isomerase-like protein (cupin superfamily)
MTQHQAIPPLPSATGFTRLKVYNTIGPDGLAGGSPHMHFSCTEAYIVVSGHGCVQTLGSQGFHEIELRAGQVHWFTPGLIHRLVNYDGELDILIVMQNAGLPEAGDAVLSFPAEFLASSQIYLQHASLSASGYVYASSEQAAEHRRNLAVQGFNALRQQVELHGTSALEPFYQQAYQIIQHQLSAWQDVWRQGPHQASQTTQHQLQALQAGDLSHLLQGAIFSLPTPQSSKLGMCGLLGTYALEGTICY